MSKDTDDPKQADLLARILAETQNINGFIVVADDAGIHWNGVRAAARVIKYLEDHTEHSEGNFHFAAGAFPPAVAPFFRFRTPRMQGTVLPWGWSRPISCSRSLPQPRAI